MLIHHEWVTNEGSEPFDSISHGKHHALRTMKSKHSIMVEDKPDDSVSVNELPSQSVIYRVIILYCELFMYFVFDIEHTIFR
jgi:hypothetical protein